MRYIDTSKISKDIDKSKYQRMRLKELFTLLCILAASDGLCCPNGWMVFDNSCYLFSDEIMVDWIEATHFCGSHYNAHLITIESQAEDKFIIDQCNRLFKHDKNNCFWLGATDDEVEGLMIWYTNHKRLSNGYTNWQPGEPTGLNQDCAVLWGPYAFNWGDYYCDRKCHAVCEKNMTTTDEQEIIG